MTKLDNNLYTATAIVAVILLAATLLLGQTSSTQPELIQRKNRSGTVVYAKPINKPLQSIPPAIKVHRWEELAFDIAGCFEWIDPSKPNPHPVTDCKPGKFKYLRIRICLVHEEVRVRIAREQ